MRKQLNLLLVAVAISAFTAGQGLGALPEYEIIDLGTLGGGDSSATAINDTGQVVGWSFTGYSSASHAFLWDSTHGMIDLGTLPGHDGSGATAINDYGIVVGGSGLFGEIWACIWYPINGMYYLEDIADSKGGAYAYGVNNIGEVVGYMLWPAARAFLWDADNGVIYLGTLGGTHSYALAINNTGKVVGTSDTAIGDNHAFLWDTDNGMRDLGTLGGSYSWANGVNDAGHVVGWSHTKNGDWHAFLWDSINGMTDLGLGIARAINDSGQVIGEEAEYDEGEYRAFYWDRHNGRIRLYELLPPGCGWTELELALDINNRGQIVGQGITDSGESHAFLMTPMLPTIEVPMKFTPQVLNCYSKGKWVKAHLVLPAEFTVEGVDSNSLTTVHPLGIEPNYTSIFVNDNGLVEIEAAFDRAYFCSVLRNSWFSEETITIRGSFISGQYFYGMDTIKVIDRSFEYLAILSSNWLESGCIKFDWCNGADIDQDSAVDFNDFALMAHPTGWKITALNE